MYGEEGKELAIQDVTEFILVDSATAGMEDFIVIDKVAGEEILMVESQRVTLPGCGVISQNSLLLQIYYYREMLGWVQVHR